jgi:hypothetical protein
MLVVAPVLGSPVVLVDVSLEVMSTGGPLSMGNSQATRARKTALDEIFMRDLDISTARRPRSSLPRVRRRGVVSLRAWHTSAER